MVETLDEYKRALPLFREDLKVFDGPSEPDGAPSYNIYDPIRAQYFKVTWSEYVLISHLKPGMNTYDLIEKVHRDTTLKVNPKEVMQFFGQARLLNLLAMPRFSEQLMEEKEKGYVNPIKWMALHYLYIRMPLFKPDAFLKRTLPYVLPLASKWAFLIYGILIITGIVMLFQRLDEFIYTFPYFFNLEGLITYAIAITCVKFIHEFGHAYTAAYYRLYVPAMGVALLVLWPVMYTDVTEGWKLPNRKHRLWISMAGVIAEMIIAGLCTLGWSLVDEGLLKSVFFVVSSATWITTLAINLNPALRFDGYYILSDLWGVDNLQPRAFAMTRWKFRKWFLGLDLPPPEERLSDKRLTALIIYSVYTWIYRLILYTTIAIFVYMTFTKALGVFLFLLEIYLFILWPLVSEVQELYKMRSFVKINARFVITCSVIGLIFLWFIVPRPTLQSFSAITIPAEEQVIYVPLDAQIEKLFVKKGDILKAGDPIIKLRSKPLEKQIRTLQIQERLTKKEIELLGYNQESIPFIPQKRAELASFNEQLQTYIQKYRELNIKAQVSGEVFAWDNRLLVGQYVSKDQSIGRVGDIHQVNAVAYIPERDINSIKAGQDVQFHVKKPPTWIPGKIESIPPIRVNTLEYPPLASIYQGDIPVTQAEGSSALIVVESYYPARIVLDKGDMQLRYGQTGEVKVWGKWQSSLVYWGKWVLSIIWGESGV